MKFFKYLYVIPAAFILSCHFSNKTDGLSGHSKTIEEARKNGSEVILFLPDKNVFHLLDGTVLRVDTAWTEVSFSFKNGKRDLDSSYGFHFSIPFKKVKPNTFTFHFSLLDTTNRMFTNGMDENISHLCPKKIYDEMKIILEQKDPDTSKGWTNPIVTDTIIYKRISH